MWLFSCSVTAISPASLMSTNSGSGSSGAMAARPVTSALTMASQSGPASPMGTIATKPAGSCGSAPSFRSSSRSFSIATARKEPSGASATESGWPPRPQLSDTSLVAMSMSFSIPEGSVKLADVLTPT